MVYGNTGQEVIISRGSCRRRETIRIIGDQIFVSKGDMKQAKKFHIGDLFRINRGLRLFRRGNTNALIAAARVVLGTNSNTL